MNVTAVGAHQDDVELFCLGTLLRCAARGDVVSHVVVTSGDKGGHFMPEATPAEVAAVRDAEAAAVAEATGASYLNLGGPDGFLRDDEHHRVALADALRRFGTDLLLAPPPVDYNADHVAASQLCFQACLLAAMPTLETAHPPLARSPALFYADAICGQEPNCHVDVSAVFARKLELLALHRSQLAILGSFGSDADLLACAEVVGRYRGLQAGVAYAEAFTRAAAWPRIGVDRSLPEGADLPARADVATAAAAQSAGSVSAPTASSGR